MQTLNFDAVIDERRTLSLVLPGNIRPGKAKVTVMLEDGGSMKIDRTAKSTADEILEAFMRFGDGRRLDGITIKEMAAEGRR